MKIIRKTTYGKIILSLVEELYKNEVVDTLMTNLIIGEGKEYSSKEDWIECRLIATLGDIK